MGILKTSEHIFGLAVVGNEKRIKRKIERYMSSLFSFKEKEI